MKKLLVRATFFSGLFFVSNLYAGDGSLNNLPSQKVWRSSYTQVELAPVMFASYPVVINNIIVIATSATGTNGKFTVYKSTSAIFDNSASTIAYRSGGSVGPGQPEFNVNSASYTYIDHKNSDPVFLLWEWLDGLLSAPNPH